MLVNRMTVEDIKNKLPLWLQSYYITTRINEIEIDGIKYTGYFDYSYLDEVNYFKSPERSSNGSIVNLNAYSRFITPHLTINYKFMNIEEYRSLMKQIISKAEFVVTCYDFIEDKRVTHNMYFTPPSMPKIYVKMLQALGVFDYNVELVGTNTDLETIKITYDNNPPINELSKQVIVENSPNNSILIGKDAIIDKVKIQDNTFGGQYKFQKWSEKKDGTGFSYADNNEYIVRYDTTLYAIWVRSI